MAGCPVALFHFLHKNGDADMNKQQKLLTIFSLSLTTAFFSSYVNAGETVCVVGSNGAGKSTLLRAVMGSQPVFEGRILFRGREIQKLRTFIQIRATIYMLFGMMNLLAAIRSTIKRARMGDRPGRHRDSPGVLVIPGNPA